MELDNIQYPINHPQCCVVYFIILNLDRNKFSLFIKITMSTPTFNRDSSPSKNKSPSKSQSKSRLNSTRNTSPNALAKKPQPSSEALASKMKSMRDKLCNILDAHILILETNAPMRCLQHNSVISLYCETEQRLLCANCVYRSNNHKLHRVSPVQKCYRQISRDVDQMSRQAERQIEWAQNSTKSIHQFFKQQQKNTNQAILGIAQMYDQLHLELEKSFEQVKKKLLITMDNCFTKKESLLLQIEFYKNIFDKNKPTAIENFQSKDATTMEYHLIFKHLIGCSLLDFGKLEGNKVLDGVSKIKQIQKKQVERLSQIKMLMQKWKQEQKEKQTNLEKQRQREREKLFNRSILKQIRQEKQRSFHKSMIKQDREKQPRRQPPKIIN